MSGARILLAEGNAANQELTAAILRWMGFSMDIVADGRQVLDALVKHSYDLVLIDCQAPEMDACGTSRLIRKGVAEARNQDIPIIALIDHAAESNHDLWQTAGMNDFLMKPIHMEALKSALRRWFPSAVAAESHAWPSSASHGIFNRTSFLERIGGDEIFAQKLIRAFLADMPVQIEHLRTAVAAGNTPEISRLSHRIKGAAANMSCERLRNAAGKIEKWKQTAENSAALLERMSELEQEYAVVAEKLECDK
jgi:two-component system, sensor histidine kinase and response regulator